MALGKTWTKNSVTSPSVFALPDVSGVSYRDSSSSMLSFRCHIFTLYFELFLIRIKTVILPSNSDLSLAVAGLGTVILYCIDSQASLDNSQAKRVN